MGPLPLTVTARRHARLRAATIWAIPLLLALVSLVPRLWQADLVRYGAPQAAYFEASAARSPDGLLARVGSPSTPALALVDSPLRAIHAPLTAWVLLRGIVDAAGVALVFVAVRPLAGVFGATLAGALYATSPVVVAASRDLAGPFGAVLAAGALLAGLFVVRRPTLLWGVVLGVLLGLLARTGGPALLVVVLGASALSVGRASWQVGGTTALALLLVGGTVLLAGLRATLTDPLGIAAGATALLTLPGGLLTGVAYGPADGGPPGVIAPSLWVTGALGMVAALGLAAGSVAAILEARRGQRGSVLLVIWLLFTGLATMLAAGADMSFSASLGAVATPPGADTAVVVLVPLLAAMLGFPNAARGPLLRWAGLSLAGLAVVAQVAALVMAGRAMQAAADVPGVFASHPQSANIATPGIGTAASLRDWLALASTIDDVTARAGVAEFVVLTGSPLADRAGLLRALVGTARTPGSAARDVAATLVLPIERETVFLLSESVGGAADSNWPVELQRPASRTAVVTAGGVDTGARLVTLRPRSAADWLARVRSVEDGRFADGSRLVGVQIGASGEDTADATLYWELPAAADGRPLAARVRVAVGSAGALPSGEQRLPAVEDRRGGELVVTRVRVPVAASAGTSAPLVVQLVDGSGRAVRSLVGGDALVLPPPAPPR